MKKKENKLTIKDELTEFLLYTAPNGDVKVEIVFHNETVWLTQKRMAELFGVDISTINEHLKNLYKTEELEEDSTIGNFPIVQNEGGQKAFSEYDSFNKTQKIDSDFDKEIRKLFNKKGKTDETDI